MTELEKKERNIRFNKIMLKIIGCIFILIILLNLFGSKDSKTSKEKEKNEVVYTTPYIRVDKSAHAVYYYLEDNLTDSTGLEIISTSAVLELNNGMFLQHVTFKSKNKFGVLVQTEMSFLMEGTGFDTVVLAASPREEMEKALSDKNITMVRGYRETESKQIEVKK